MKFPQMISKITALLLVIISFNLLGQLQVGVEECSKSKISYFNANARLLNNYQFPGDPNIDVNYYKLNLDITYTPNYLKGIATIKAKSLQNQLNEAIIDLQNALTVDSIYVGNTKTTFTHLTAKINVNLLKNYALNEQFTLTIYYQGKPGSSGFGSFVFGDHGPSGAKQPAIWSLSEPFGASDWFPCKDNPADKADSSDVWITAPKEFVSVSNGLLEQKTEHITTNTYKWKSRYPIANYLISITLANYEMYHNDFNYGSLSPMPVDHYIYPEVFDNANKLLMDETVFMLNLFTEKFGPYPFLKEKYGHAMFGWGGGMEHQTCTSLINFSSGLVAHELTHQWFGDKITCSDWANIWLNEGFATFGALLYWEAKNGIADYNSKITGIMTNAKTAKGSIWVQNPASVNEIFNGARSYNKGGIVLHMLRNIVGDVTFFNILRAYAASNHAYGNATTEDFQQIAETISGLDLNYFFSQWIYGENYPKYQFGWTVVTSSSARANAPNIKYSLKTKITQSINTKLPAFFTMPVKLKITFEDNSTEIAKVFNNLQDQYFEFDFAKKPIAVDFDSENGILKDLTIVPLNLPLSLEENPVLIMENEKETIFAKEIQLKISPNPAQDETAIHFELRKAESFTLQLFNQNGKITYNSNESIPAKTVKQIIPTTNLPNGEYLLQLKIGQNIINRKIMVMH